MLKLYNLISFLIFSEYNIILCTISLQNISFNMKKVDLLKITVETFSNFNLTKTKNKDISKLVIFT